MEESTKRYTLEAAKEENITPPMRAAEISPVQQWSSDEADSRLDDRSDGEQESGAELRDRKGNRLHAEALETIDLVSQSGGGTT